MPLIVVMDDDSSTRVLVSAVLRKEGYNVLTAEDGQEGLALIREHHPELIVSDVQMPHLDGFGVLEAVRSDPNTSTTPVILLTSLQERTHMRQGMTTGADDYITKPFMPQELRDAVNAQLSKLVRAETATAQIVDRAVANALAEQQQKIGALYELRLARDLSNQWPDSDLPSETERFNKATVLYADMRDYALWTQRLSSSELSDLIKRFYSSVGDTVHLFGAKHMQFVGDGMLCVFVDSEDSHSVNHAQRATKAAMGLQDGCSRMDSFVQQHFRDRQLPAFRLNVALQTGSVSFAALQGMFSNASRAAPVGDSVTTALKLFQGQPSLDWKIATTAQTHVLLGPAVKTGRRQMVQLAGRNGTVDAIELLGFGVN